jgi:Tropinone reductase 1
VHVQVNNAALLMLKPPAEYTAEDYSRIMATNLESCFHLSQLAHPLLRQSAVAGGGSIVHISSIAGFLAFPHEALYSVTKGT